MRKEGSAKGHERNVCFLLHTHLPFGHRPDLEFSMEEGWLYELTLGSYLPLLKFLEKLSTNFQYPSLTLSLSPPILELWSLPDFADRFHAHVSRGIRILDSEVEAKSAPTEQRDQAKAIKAHWIHAQEYFQEIDGNLIAAFCSLAKGRIIELITTTATHTFLPAFQKNQVFRRFQIRVGIECFKRHTGIAPEGFWLPECGYFEGLENDLSDFGIKYFGVESNSLYAATPSCSTRTPVACPNRIYAIGRNETLSKKVWSAHSGYPGNIDYREFHKDRISQIDTNKAGLFALPGGERIPMGLKYWRVTGTQDKDWYHSQSALKAAKADAMDFSNAIRQSKDSCIFLPFDTELFGHWWHEGINWIDNVFSNFKSDPQTKLVSVSEMLKSCRMERHARPATSTWGRNADASFWVNHDNDWIYPMIETAFESLLVQCNDEQLPHEKMRILQQACRELLAASASDWPFMISAGTTSQYAEERIRDHLKRFHYLLSDASNQHITSRKLDLLESSNPIFKDQDLIAALRLSRSKDQ